MIGASLELIMFLVLVSGSRIIMQLTAFIVLFSCPLMKHQQIIHLTLMSPFNEYIETASGVPMCELHSFSMLIALLALSLLQYGMSNMAHNAHPTTVQTFISAIICAIAMPRIQVGTSAKHFVPKNDEPAG